MKYIDTTPTGGQPIKFMDLLFMTEAYSHIYLATFGHLSTNYCWNLTGFSIETSTDGSTVTIEAGYVWFAGELLQVPEHEVTGDSGQTAEWYIDQTYDSRGLKTFYDSEVGDVNTYIVRQLKVKFSDSATFPITITREYLSSPTDWVTPTLASGWGESSAEGIVDLSYRLDRNGNLQLRGSIYVDSTSNVGFTLPEDYRPDEDVLIHVPSYISGSTLFDGSISNSLTIRANGEVYFNSMTNAIHLNNTIILDN